MSARSIDLVCFDWGGVIVRICRSWQEGCTLAGLPVRADTASDEVKARRRAIAEDFQVGGMTAAEFYSRLAEATGGVYSAAEIERIHHAWLIEEYAGIGDVIDDLSRVAGIETGLLSNTNEEHWRRYQPDRCTGLRCFPAVSRLTHRHASHLLKLAKPGLEIYHAFAARTGRHPGSILFFDDLLENVEAARAAGWQAEQIDHAGDTAAQVRMHLRRHGVM